MTQVDGKEIREGAEVLPRATAPRERIQAIDVLRGFALLGIVFMNIPFAGLPGEAGWIPTIAGGITGADWWAWFLAEVFVDGKARALFSLLFGAGVILITERAEASGLEGRARAADIHYRRMLWLMAFGIVDSYLLIWPGDIIWLYGLCGLLLFPLRKLSARALFFAAAVLFVMTIAYGFIEREVEKQELAEITTIRATVAAGEEITKEQQKQLDDWKKKLEEMVPPPEEVEKELEKRRGGYVSNLMLAAPITKKIQSTPLYLETDAIYMMLIGMGLARARVITGGRSAKFYAMIAVVCLPLGWAIAALGPWWWSGTGFDLEAIAPWWASWAWAYPVQRVLQAIGYMSLAMLLVRMGALRALWNVVAAAGRMPLTNYLGQSIIYVILFTGVGFGMVDRLSRWELMVTALVIWMAQAVVSTAWLRVYAYGPMEYVWRWLTYARRPE